MVAAHHKAVVVIQVEHGFFERKIPTKSRMENTALTG